LSYDRTPSNVKAKLSLLFSIPSQIVGVHSNQMTQKTTSRLMQVNAQVVTRTLIEEKL
jgi:hypothetical protein